MQTTTHHHPATPYSRLALPAFVGRLWLLALPLCTMLLSSCGYNSMVEKRNGVEQAASQVQNVYQRRADLIPNLVETVKGAANFEKGTLVEVTQARASATQVKLDPANLTPENMAQFQQAQAGLSGALSRLLVASENYPDLKANANFQQLTAELAGTENRITVERMKFNEATQDFNTTIETFPNNLTAGMFGFSRKPYFEAKAGSDVAPKVKF